MAIRRYPPQSDQITLSAAADAVLSITAPAPGQEIGLDTQLANTVFAGPTAGAPAEPTFRALGFSDLPTPIVMTVTATAPIASSGGANPDISLNLDGVTNAYLANMATARIKGRFTAGTGDPEDLTGTQATTILDNFIGDSGAGGTKGLVPAPAAGDAVRKFLSANGSWKDPSLSPVVTKLANYTATSSDYFIICDASGGAFTITLPASAGITGRTYTIKRINTAPNTVTVDADGAELIDGSASVVLRFRYESITLICDGIGWNIV